MKSQSQFIFKVYCHFEVLHAMSPNWLYTNKYMDLSAQISG